MKKPHPLISILKRTTSCADSVSGFLLRIALILIYLWILVELSNAAFVAGMYVGTR